MCGRFSLVHTTTEVLDAFGITESVPIAPRYNIAPTQPVAIVRDHPHRDGIRELAHVVWGLIPPWAEDTSMCGRMFNARSETASEKPAFRHALRRRRCIIPVSGFYEWKTEESSVVRHKSDSLFDDDDLPDPRNVKTRQTKRPFYVSRTDGQLLALAGLWEIWDGPNGENIESCTILTTRASRLLGSLYERMPVLMPSNHVSQWLDRYNESAQAIDRLLLASVPDKELQIQPVSQLVNNARIDTPECIAPV